MFNLISLLLTSAMLAYMLRYRVHIHVNLTPPEPPADVVGAPPPDSAPVIAPPMPPVSAGPMPF